MVSSSALCVVSKTNVEFDGACHFHQTGFSVVFVTVETSTPVGSLSSTVAPTFVPLDVPPTPEMTVGLPKLSFGGGTAGDSAARATGVRGALGVAFAVEACTA